MNLKLQFLSVGLLALLATGCSSSDKSIVFLSEAKLPASVTVSGIKSGGLSNAEEQQIDLLVFGNLIEHTLWKSTDYSALFLQADDAVVTALIKQYPDHVPPIKDSSHIDLRVNQSPLDRDTGRPALILSAEVGEPAGDSVDVVGRWYGGASTTGSQTFSLKKTGGVWIIAGVK